MRPHINNISAALLTVCQWGLPMGQEEGFFWGVSGVDHTTHLKIVLSGVICHQLTACQSACPR